MTDHYRQVSSPRALRKVKRLPLLPRGVPDFSGQDEPLSPALKMRNREMISQNDDDEKREKAYQELATVWQERLQLISAISTFFASTESGMLQKVGFSSRLLVAEIAYAALLGALIIHIFVAFVAFLASFLLVDYRIHETETELPRGTELEVDKSEKRRAHSSASQPPTPANPRLVPVGLFKRRLPVHLLGRCHSLCVTLASIGFVLAFIGVCCFAWTISNPSVSIFATVCVTFCIVLAIGVFAMYDSEGIVIKVNVSLT